MEIIVFGALVLIALWYLDRRRHPLKKCPACKGNPGKKMSRWDGTAYGACSRCGGRGEVNR